MRTSILTAVTGIGVELEGGWPATYELNPIVHDGSVRRLEAAKIGEVRSPVLRSLVELDEFVKANYPTKVNETCGLHTHMSFMSGLGPAANTWLIAAMADSPLFCGALIGHLTHWGSARNIANDQFWQRLAGHNEYCMKRWDPQGLRNDGRRYYQVNFGAFRRHGTLEIRVLPMFTSARLAMTALAEVICFTDAFASALAECKTDDVCEVLSKEVTI